MERAHRMLRRHLARLARLPRLAHLARPFSRAALLLSIGAAACAEPATAIECPKVPESPPAAPARATPPAAPEARAPEPPVAPEPPASPKAPGAFDLAAIDDYVARQVKERGFVGVSLAILHDGKVVHAKGYGKRSIKTGEPVSVDTAFAIGSVTKQLTAASVLLLAQDGKLSAKDKVAKYFPDLTRAKDITLHDLMSHVAGYPDYYPLDFTDRRMQKPVTHAKLLKDYAGGKLDFEPGTRFSYSNTGYIILGRVVEKVSGEPLGTFMEKRIFGPLGMTRTSLDPAPDKPGLAAGHTSFALGDPEIVPPEGEGWLHGAGGVYSTPSDLAKWNLALIDGRVLKPEGYSLMITPRKLADGTLNDYACGIVASRRGSEPVLTHGGAVSGFLAFNTILPRTKSAVILMANNDGVDPGPLHREIVSLLVKKGAPASGIPKVQGPPAKEITTELLRQMQAGAVDRAALGEEFSQFLTNEKVQRASLQLKALGEPTKIDVDETYERGGMEVAVVRITFKTAQAKALLYRTPDGKVQQFLLYRM